MKNYTVTIQYEKDRNSFGFPIFNSITIDIKAINLDHVNNYLKKLYNNNYHITDISESYTRM